MAENWWGPLLFFIIIALFFFDVRNWKARVVDNSCDAWALCFGADTLPACPLNHWQFLPLSPPSQVVLIKSVSLAWQAKIIGECFWMPFTLNGASTHSLAFLHSHRSFRLTTPLPLFTPHLLAKSYLSSPLFFRLHLIFKRDIWINFFCGLRGRLPVNCKFWPTPQFISHGNLGKAIYWESGGSLNSPPFEKRSVFPLHGEHLLKKYCMRLSHAVM